MRKIEPFRFKHFEIHHHYCAHKVGTDGVLLGAWTPAKNPKKILDVGTGSGLVALMLAQRFPQAHITAIELDRASAAQAKENAVASPFADRVEILCDDFLKHDFIGQFDLIVSNPPFFKGASSSGNSERDQARHEEALPQDKFVEKAVPLLSPNGSLAVVLPKEEGQCFLEKAAAQGLALTERTKVFGAPYAPEKRWLLSFSQKDGQSEENSLTLRQKDNSFSEEYIRLTKEFYLNL